MCHRCRSKFADPQVPPRPREIRSHPERFIGDDFEWGDPPATTMGQYGRSVARQRIDAVVERLQTRPGCWACVLEGSTSSNAGITLEARGCEVARRKTGKNAAGRRLFSVWARWPVPGGES